MAPVCCGVPEISAARTVQVTLRQAILIVVVVVLLGLQQPDGWEEQDT